MHEKIPEIDARQMPADLRDVIDEKAGENPRASFFSLRLTWKISLLMFQTPGLIWNRARLGFHSNGRKLTQIFLQSIPTAYSHLLKRVRREVSLYLGASAKILTSWLFAPWEPTRTLVIVDFRMGLYRGRQPLHWRRSGATHWLNGSWWSQY